MIVQAFLSERPKYRVNDIFIMVQRTVRGKDTMIKHIIFDCFGTLIDTGTGSRDAVKSILARVGSDIDCNEFYKNWNRKKKEMMRSESFQTEKKLFELSLSDTFIRYNIKADASKEVEPTAFLLT